MLYSFSLLIYRQFFFANMFLKLIEKMLQWNEFCEIGASLITYRERLDVQKQSKRPQLPRVWINLQLFCKLFDQLMWNQIFDKPFDFYSKPKNPWKF